MGMVYKAEDLKLGRRVALKFLPEEVATDSLTLQRFEREARTASSLNHPNICTIHEVEEHEGQPFLVMELMEGETLRDRLASVTSGGKAMSLNELLDIAIQIAGGLQAAHEKGIIHRDIKPGNIFLTAQGQVKILDFGLAKLAELSEPEAEVPNLGLKGCGFSRTVAASSFEMSGLQPQPGLKPASNDKNDALNGTPKGVPLQNISRADPTLTRTGHAMGTAGYMSPEQARGEKLDARTDLFSFGLVLYEMATGKRAFSGDTAAILKDAILNHTPAPVRDLNSTLPSELEEIISKALQKERELRYQAASEMRADLESVAADSPIQSDSTESRVLSRWKVLATAAVVVIALIASGLYWRRSHKTTTKLTEKDTIVLADFSNSTGDPIFDGTLRSALSIDLEQSPSLNVLSERKVSETLKLMNRSSARLTPDLTRQVCLSTKSKALLSGAIADEGNRYVVGLIAMDCQTGDTLANIAVEAENRDQVIHALGEAGTRLRTSLGDSSASLEKFNKPLETTLTPSLDALQAYTQGQNANGPAEAVPHFRRAVELDPNFAVAYYQMGRRYLSSGQVSRASESHSKAYALRDRLSLRHRLLVEAGYYMGATGEVEKAIQTFRELILAFPESGARTQLSYELRRLGRHEQAAAMGREAIQFNRDEASAVANTMYSYTYLERPGDARAAFDEARARNVDGEQMRIMRYVLAFVQGDQGAMREQLTWAMGKPRVEDLLLSNQADTETFYGRLGKARELSQRAVDSAKQADAPETAAWWRANEALREAELGNAPVARRVIAEALVLSSGPIIESVAALTLARAGVPLQAQKFADKLNREFPLDTMLQAYSLPTMRASIELQKNNSRKAIEILQASTSYELGIPYNVPTLYRTYLRGEAFLHAGHGKQAAAEFQKVLDHPGLVQNFVSGALAHLQLGRAQVMMGDKGAARKSYQDFLTLWRDADPDIPIYQQAKAEYARLH